MRSPSSRLVLLTGLYLVAQTSATAADRKDVQDMQPTPQYAAPSQDEVVLSQGIPTRFAGQLLALGDPSPGADGERQVDISLSAEGGAAAWQSRVLLRVGDVFPARAGFLRLRQLQPGNGSTRARAVVAHATDTGGIALPAATDRVLVRGGRARFANRWIEAVAIDGDTAEIEYWPVGEARSKLADDAVPRARLRAGDTLELGDGTEPLRIERVQPDAGEVLGFIAFAADQGHAGP
jgi:hypothetical protein